MKLQIFGEEREEKIIRFKLFCNDNEVTLAVVTEEGEIIREGSIITISESGTLIRHAFINKNIGLKLDEDGRIIINKE